MKFFSISTLTALAVATGAAASSSKPNTPAFSYTNSTFLLHGQPYTILGGQMDPQRIPREFWRDRLAKVRALGLNTVFSYVYWHFLEPEPGHWDNQGANDIAEYFRLAQEEGLHVVLRPGPYICGERDWGGFPYWLSNVPDLVVRSDNVPFLNAAEGYLQHLASDLRGLLVEDGGPILMVQLENEYGSYGNSTPYKEALGDILRRMFPGAVLYTNDGGGQAFLEGGSLPGVLAETDGIPEVGFVDRDKYVDPTSLGPQLDGEYYTTWLDTWSSTAAHQLPNAKTAQGFVDDLQYILANASGSFSLYMVHGGTNFGFGNGGLWSGNKTLAVTTSYDYGAPIDESGRPEEFYYALRNAIAKYAPERNIPAVPETPDRMSIPEFTLTPFQSLFDNLGKPVSSKSPKPMEQIGQGYGYILYEHIATAAVSGRVQPGDRARDRVIVYVNDVVQGVIDSQYQYPANVTVSLRRGDRLRLLVENLGRVDYWNRGIGGPPETNMVLEPNKGIVGDVSVGNTVLHGWNLYPLPLKDVPHGRPSHEYNTSSAGSTSTPMFYQGSFEINKSHAQASNPAGLDTFLSIPAGFKGVVFVNGFNLGRYFCIGPQQSLYLPGSLVRRGRNDVVVLELEPQHVNKPLTAQGLSSREWFNQPDADCPGCK